MLVGKRRPANVWSANVRTPQDTGCSRRPSRELIILTGDFVVTDEEIPTGDFVKHFEDAVDVRVDARRPVVLTE